MKLEGDKMENQIIGDVIVKKRKEKGMTQKDLADQLNITDRAVSKWERGICCPDISLLREIASILDVSISELICGEKVDEKTIIKTIAYTKESIKQKVKRIINIIIIVIIILTLGFITLSLIKVEYGYHKHYNFSNQYQELSKANKEVKKERISDIKDRIKTISNDNGVFKDDDYNLVMQYLKSINQVLNLDEEKYFLKDYYTYKDLEVLNDNYQNQNDRYIDFSVDNVLDVYYKLSEYDLTIIERITTIKDMTDNHYNFKSDLISFINNISLFSSNTPKKIADKVYNSLDNRYELYIMVLNDIIEVGEINENN